MNLPKSTTINKTELNSEIAIELRKMEYNGKTTYSVGKAIQGSFYPKTYINLSEAQSDYNNLIKGI